MIDYNNRSFSTISNTDNGETSSETIFHYVQSGKIITAAYSGGKIKLGHLIGVVNEDGVIDIRYHQVNEEGKLMTGICRSVPEVLKNNKIRLHETWQWTSGDHSNGKSIIEEI
ncbi:n-acetylglutamate synthase [Mucilaginibacter sp. BJC16-A38]|uniref:n-acetylglutamate synthase n=1 Tax=Mucilaginibacter phenanthrenivorans TaxID=1234842 RepID=UPI0021579B4E|nr:n-acetylglutamate synthase [Mucilaginibacter phenanthrenivorans]MCR8560929.1 n-acetylglutamate synthase [Mucilaginibacter phenanthrenivorans]